MFKFAILLCAALLASGVGASGSSLLEKKQATSAIPGILSGALLDPEKADRLLAKIRIEAKPRPEIRKKGVESIELDAKTLEAEYNSSRDDWFSATKNATKAMEHYSNMAGTHFFSVEQMYRAALNDVKVYVNMTQTYSTRALKMISRTSKSYSRERYEKLNSHVREVKRTVDNLIHQTGNVSDLACKTYPNDLTTSMSAGGKGMSVLWIANECSKQIVKKAIDIANSTFQKIVREFNRLEEIRRFGSNCLRPGCDTLTKRQIARAGSTLVNSVRVETIMLGSIVLNFPKTQEGCNKISGLVDYHTNLTTILEDARRCIEQRTMKDATAISVMSEEKPKAHTSNKGSSDAKLDLSRYDTDMELTATVPKDYTWKAPVKSHKDAAEELINKTMKKYARWIDGGGEVNNPLLAELMQQSKAFNALIQNNIDILKQTIKSSVENRTSLLHDVDFSKCERYSDFLEAAETARIKGPPCTTGILSLITKTIETIEATTFKELKRVDAIQKRAQHCGDNFQNVSSAVNAMMCYHDHKIQVSRGFEQTERWLKIKVTKLVSLFASFEENFVACRKESWFILLSKDTVKIVNEINKCIQRKINDASVTTNEGDPGTTVAPQKQAIVEGLRVKESNSNYDVTKN